MKILFTGPLTPVGTTSEMRRLTLERLGHQTVPLDYMALVQSYPMLIRKIQWRMRAGAMVRRYNDSLAERLKEPVDAFWIEKGVFVYPEVIVTAKHRGIKTILYSPDNYFLAQNCSRHLWKALADYSLVVTTKPDKIEQLKEAGARKVLLSGNAYDPEVHRPISQDDPELAKYACDVSFIGRWEPEREIWLEEIAKTGVHLSVRGYQWDRARSNVLREVVHDGPVLSLDYARAICAARINLAFLSRLAADVITQRSVEIPACGGFMLAERTKEQLAHFEENKEAAYFEGMGELLTKIHFYLEHEKERHQIANSGRARCLAAGYSYDARLRQILDEMSRST